MQHKTLDYAMPEPRGERPSLVVLAAVAPPVMFAIYFFGTIVLYEVLNKGDRGSLQRTAGWMALPTGLVTFAACMGLGPITQSKICIRMTSKSKPTTRLDRLQARLERLQVFDEMLG